MSENQNQPVDVLVIGAGLAGLSAARKVKQEGISFAVVEASNRGGGKVQTEFSADGKRFFEQGAQYVNRDMTEMISLIQEAGMELKQTNLDKDSIVINEKNAKAIDLGSTRGAALLNQYTVDSDKPLSSALDEVVKDKWEKKMISSYIAAETTVNTDQINAAAANRMISRVTTQENELKYQASGPLNNVIHFLEDELSDQIYYCEPVVSIETVDGMYKATTEHGNQYHARSVILAIPPTVARRIALPDEVKVHFEEALSSYIDGAVIKMTLVYDDDFWRHKKVRGKERKIFGVIYAGNEGVNLMDASQPEGENRLTLFIGGDKARELVHVTAEVRENYALDRLSEVFGDDAENFQDIEESIWVNSRYSGGGYGAMIHPEGDSKANQQLSQPFRRIVFAGTELAPRFPHFMEGAVRSGQQSAERLLKELSR
ncbi:Amine oxidase [flavin-containing] A [Alkalibacterium sp. AK22]|uniref:flavin monoamine oxidase family protein n=1 Tax=Alkalibacterium sp. AK22 TaxID=1229520 RepID=UPI0004506939|nr:FAD-dependent oxidoreductase [Alkalibacterium sp. AK22]EXJ23051.1 Amine oxidase [flavin-containing] A [Alkalibacterium sp. AK22]